MFDSPDKPKMKRTNSELEVAKDMERMLFENQDLIRSTTMNIWDFQSATYQENEMAEYGKNHWITDSIYIDKKGELVVTPFYTQIKYWFIIISINIDSFLLHFFKLLLFGFNFI